MKNTWLVSGLIGALVIAGLWYARDSVVPFIIGAPAGRAHEVPAAVSVVSEVPLTTTSQYVSVQGMYPQFTNTSPAFNAHIKDTIHAAQAEFEKNATENWQGFSATDTEGLATPNMGEEAVVHDVVQALPEPKDRYQFTVDYEVTLNDARYVSLAMRYGGYVGGAHGYQNVVTFTYDKRIQREVTIADLYSTPEQLKEMVEEIRPKLITQLAQASEQKESEIDAQWVNEGTDPAKLDNFKAFTLAYVPEIQGDHITFYFQQYQVAAYVFGMPEVSILYGM